MSRNMSKGQKEGHGTDHASCGTWGEGIQVIPNEMGGGVSNFHKKSIMKVYCNGSMLLALGGGGSLKFLNKKHYITLEERSNELYGCLTLD